MGVLVRQLRQPVAGRFEQGQVEVRGDRASKAGPAVEVPARSAAAGRGTTGLDKCSTAKPRRRADSASSSAVRSRRGGNTRKSATETAMVMTHESGDPPPYRRPIILAAADREGWRCRPSSNRPTSAAACCAVASRDGSWTQKHPHLAAGRAWGHPVSRTSGCVGSDDLVRRSRQPGAPGNRLSTDSAFSSDGWRRRRRRAEQPGSA